jgi:hypothetical protein
LDQAVCGLLVTQGLRRAPLRHLVLTLLVAGAEWASCTKLVWTVVDKLLFHHHQVHTSSSGRPVDCMSILLKQQLRALGLQIIIHHTHAPVHKQCHCLTNTTTHQGTDGSERHCFGGNARCDLASGIRRGLVILRNWRCPCQSLHGLLLCSHFKLLLAGNSKALRWHPTVPESQAESSPLSFSD